MDMPGLLSVLADHGFADETTARKVDFINNAYWDTCAREPWPFLEKSITLTFDGVNATPVNYPTDVATVLNVIDPARATKLEPIRLDEFRNINSSQLTRTDYPCYYYFLAQTLYVWPIPPATDTLLLAYVSFPNALTDVSVESDIIIPPRFHSLLWLCALSAFYDMEDDPELANKFEGKYERKLEYMRNQVWLRQTDRADTIYITDYQDKWD